jgi:hypothetical protein
MHYTTYISVPLSHLFNNSGSGKTRLCFEGLCYNWGLYISCRADKRPKQDGSDDFRKAVELIPSLSDWREVGEDSGHFISRAQAADRAFTMLLCSRVFVLKAFIDQIPRNACSQDARRRWILAQALPPQLENGGDIFLEVFQSLRKGDTPCMKEFIASTIKALRTERKDLFPDDKLFSVLDEAQDASRALNGRFPSSSESKHSILHEIYKHLTNVGIFNGIILSGTGLSREVVEEETGSMGAKRMNPIYVTRVFTDTGDFRDAGRQEAYVRQYINLSGNVSDTHLLRRIQHWLKGRYAYPQHS